MIYDYIASYCSNKKITVTELERDAGLGKGAIGKWKDGVSQPSLPKLQALSRTMGIALTTLVKEWESKN